MLFTQDTIEHTHQIMNYNCVTLAVALYVQYFMLSADLESINIIFMINIGFIIDNSNGNRNKINSARVNAENVYTRRLLEAFIRGVH